MPSGTQPNRPAALGLGAEFGETAVRLLEVVADDLLELLAATVEPAGEPLVMVGALALRDPFVGRVADEDVAEAECVVDGFVRADQLPAHERRQPASRGTPTIRRELAEGFPLEVEPDYGRTLDDLALVVGERIQARGEESLDRGRHLVGRRSVGDHREQLLDEQRVALGDVSDARARRVVHFCVSEEVLDELVRFLVRERLERDRLPGPGGSCVAEVRSREAEEEHRRISRPVGDVLDQIEQRRLRPVDVFEDEGQRMLARPLLQPLSHRPRDVLRPPGRERIRPRVFRVRMPIDLRERPVGDALAVRETPPDEHVCLSSERRGDLASKPRLADSRRSERRHEAARAIREGAGERFTARAPTPRACRRAASRGDARRPAHPRRRGGVGRPGQALAFP